MTLFTPTLPSETWRVIFRWATDVPGSLDPSHETIPLSSFNKPHALKRTIASVSRHWREIAHELVYEHIILPRRSAIAPLVRVLCASETECTEDENRPPPLGWWTRRLDIETQREDGAEGDDETDNDDAARDIEGLLRYFPNLQILMHVVPAKNIWRIDNVADKYPPTTAQSLRRLKLVDGPLGGVQVLPFVFLRQCASLETLWVVPSGEHPGLFRTPSFCSLSFRHLHTLVLGVLFGWEAKIVAEQWELPALRAVVFVGWFVRVPTERVLAGHGAKLHELTFCWPRSGGDVITTSAVDLCLESHLARIEVTHLLLVQGGEEELGVLANLCSDRSGLPVLSQVVFVDATVEGIERWRRLHASAGFEQMLCAAASSGVSVLDCDGQSIST